jgi:hypothetical protein
VYDAGSVVPQKKLETFIFKHLTTKSVEVRSKEGLEWLTKYHNLDDHNPTVEYYLGILCLNRFEFKRASRHIHRCEEILAYRDHHPQALQSLLSQLRMTAPYY